ncbi:unnamed protein product, partial [Ixodes hexagonus]
AFGTFLHTTLAFTCPRLAPTSISGKIIPCRYLCIRISFVEMPAIILEKERDGALCRTLFLRRRGTCQGGSCVPFPDISKLPKETVPEKARPPVDEPPVTKPPVTSPSAPLSPVVQPPASRPSDQLSPVPQQPSPPPVIANPPPVATPTGSSTKEARVIKTEATPEPSLAPSPLPRPPPPRPPMVPPLLQPPATQPREEPPDGGVPPPPISSS